MDLNYFIMPMMMAKLETIMEYWIILVPFLLIFYVINNPNTIRNIEDIYEDYFKRIPKGMVILESKPNRNKNSSRYQAIMWYLSTNSNETIHRSSEVYFQKYNYRTENEVSKHFFRVDQIPEFKINKDIMGKVETIEKEEKTGDVTSIKEENYRIKIFSYSKSICQLIKFLDNLVDKHQKNQLEKNLSNPIIVESIYNKKDDCFDYYTYKWETNVSFENRFFENKAKILEQIDFFLENPDYFERKGIPYQLGILLHGVPGCGKTSFIKALAKKTQRHIIDIKLNDSINLTELKQLFLDEELDDNIIIPIEKRLYVLEDIDVMGEIVHKRSSIKKKSEDSDSDDESPKKTDKKEKNMGKQLLKIFGEATVSSAPNVENNNMSYLLNILDGIQENKGRIIIMTTNHIEKIDKAIIRPGRIDINLEFKEATKPIINEILSHYWEEKVELVNDYLPIPHCQVVEYCRSSSSLEETIEKLNFKSKKDKVSNLKVDNKCLKVLKSDEP